MPRLKKTATSPRGVAPRNDRSNPNDRRGRRDQIAVVVKVECSLSMRGRAHATPRKNGTLWRPRASIHCDGLRCRSGGLWHGMVGWCLGARNYSVRGEVCVCVFVYEVSLNIICRSRFPPTVMLWKKGIFCLWATNKGYFLVTPLFLTSLAYSVYHPHTPPHRSLSQTAPPSAPHEQHGGQTNSEHASYGFEQAQ